MRLSFGMAVMENDGAEAGTLDRVLVDPDKREVTHVVVRSPRVSEEVLLPLNLAQGSLEDRLLLHAASSDLENMPRYYEGRTSSSPSDRVDTSVVREPPERRQSLDAALNVPANAVQLGPETKVITADGAEGRLVGLAAEPYINGLAELQAEGLRDHPVVIPERWIGGELHDEAITLSISAGQLNAPHSA